MRAEYIWLVDAWPYSIAGSAEERISAANRAFTTGTSDDPADYSYRDRLTLPLSFSSSLFGPGRLSGASVPGAGEIRFSNVDGFYDDKKTALYSWEGRRVRVRRGEPGDALSAYRTWELVARGALVGTREMVVQVHDRQFLFDVKAHSRFHAGMPTMLRLDGVGDYIECPAASGMMDLTEFTVEIRVRRPRSPKPSGHERLVHFGTVLSNFGVRLWETAGSYGALRVDHGSNQVSSTLNHITGDLLHVSVVVDDGDLLLYEHGELVASGTFSAPSAVTDTFCYIGQANGGGEQLEGDVQEVRFWSAALTADDVRSRLYSPLTGLEANLHAYWPLNEGVDFTAGPPAQDDRFLSTNRADAYVFDNGPSAYHGELKGDPVWVSRGW